MDKLQVITIFSLVITSITIFGSNYRAKAEQPPRSNSKPEAEEAASSLSAWDVLKSGFSVYTSSPISSGYFGKLKASLTQAYLNLFPPNIEGSNKGGGGENNNVKEAISKSFEKGKENIEASAEAAAAKVKNTLSSNDHGNRPNSPHSPEL